MKRFAQIFAGLLLVFILLLVGLVVFFPKEKIKNLVLQKIQEQTDLPIQIKDIGLSFFPHFAFHLQGFAVGGQEHLVFVSVEDFEIRSGLTAFLDKEINISDIIVQKPILKIYTKYSDQVSVGTEKDPQNNVDLETKTHSDSDDIGFFITNFHIEDGELWIYDKNDQEEIKIKDLDQSLTIKLSPNKDLEINGNTSITEVWSKHLHMPAISVVMQNNLIFQDEQQKLVINNSTFTVQDLPIFLNGFIQGKEDGNVVADIALKTEPTELSSIFQLVPALQNQDWQTKGRFAVQGRINGLFVEDDFLGSFEKSQTNLLLTLEQGQIANKAHDVFFAPVSLETTITPLSIKLHKLHLASKNSNLDVTGHISNYLQEALVGFSVKANADLKEVQPWLDKKRFPNLKDKPNSTWISMAK
ncbi:MAG: AsmA family protein [Bdellovibrionota bacterium]